MPDTVKEDHIHDEFDANDGVGQVGPNDGEGRVGAFDGEWKLLTFLVVLAILYEIGIKITINLRKQIFLIHLL